MIGSWIKKKCTSALITALASQMNGGKAITPGLSSVVTCNYASFFLGSPMRNFANQVAGCRGNIFCFGYAAVDQRAPGAFPDFSHNQRAVFAHDPAEMLNGGSSRRFTNQFGGSSRCHFTVASGNLAHS